MHQVDLNEAKTHLTDLIEAAVKGEEVVITRDDQPLVRLVPVSKTKKIKILFLATNPADVQQLRIDQEFRHVVDRIRESKYRDQIEIVSEWSVGPDNLRKILLHQPHILHFSGHGQKDGSPVLEDDSGNADPIDPAIFARLLELLKGNIRLVLLNACYSKEQAEMLGKTFDYTIGMNRPILDATAKVFAATFYQEIANDRSVKKAFDLACAQLDLSKISGADTPELLVREGVDTTEPFLSQIVEKEEKQSRQSSGSSGSVNNNAGTVDNYGIQAGVMPVKADQIDALIKNTGKTRKPGSAKGMITISDDFDEPLEDFKEYM